MRALENQLLQELQRTAVIKDRFRLSSAGPAPVSTHVPLETDFWRERLGL
jgi:hypothetical protein